MSELMPKLHSELQRHADNTRAAFSSNWFKNRPGYPPDDLFLGVKVPVQRKIAKQFFKIISLADTKVLIRSKWHEERLTGLFVLVYKYQKFPTLRQEIFDLYMENLQFVNNWDLVDSSAPYIVGEHLQNNSYRQKVLLKMAKADGVWERRVAMLAAGQSLRHGNPGDVLLIAKSLLSDNDDYIHKAVGWMLREMGKQVDRKLLLSFLDKHAHEMPRTALRYSIEHLDTKTRKYYLGVRNAK